MLPVLSFQLFEEGFEQPRMTGRRDKAILACLVDALDKSTGQTELDELRPELFPLFLVARGNGATLVDQGFDAALGSVGRCLGFRLRFAP